MDPTVSVIIPTYNGDAFLDETLASLRAQTFSDFEVVAVDDGSTDGTVGILRRHAGARFRVLEQANAGPSAARQNGLDHARGRVILFLDHDDRLVPDALARGVAALDADPDLAVAYGDRVYIDPAGARFGPTGAPRRGGPPQGDVFVACLEAQFIATTGQACIAARHLAALGGLPDQPGIGNDWALWCLLATQGPFRHLDGGPTLEYRQHPGNRMRSFMDRTRAEVHIDELAPAVDHVFRHPLVRARGEGLDLARSERRRRAYCHAIKGDRFLRAGQAALARGYYRRALALRPGWPRALVTLALTFLNGIPAPMRRLMGVYER